MGAVGESLQTSKKKLRILTTNRHEIYLSLMSGLSVDIDVLTSVGRKLLPWRSQYGDLPAGLNLVEWGSLVEERVRSGYYDCVVLHTIEDLIAFQRFTDGRYVFVIHLALYTHSMTFKIRAVLKKIILKMFLMTHDCQVVGVSPWKLSTWGKLPSSEVILLASTEMPQADFNVREARLITVGNQFVSRPELNFELLSFISQKIPVTVCGLNPDVPGAILPKSRAELLGLMAQHQIYLYTTEYPWNDGYNTSVLEAMRAGLAVVSMAHPTSPVVHGKGGFQAKTREELLSYILELRSDVKLCRDFGEYNRKLIDQKFSYRAFIDSWDGLLKGRTPL